MKKSILRKKLQLRKRGVDAGSKGELVLVQDALGGHLVTLPAGDLGFVDVATAPHAVTLVSWSKDDERTLWHSIKMTPDTVINAPSAISNLVVEIVDTVSAKIKFNAPQGISGDDNVKADLYYLIISESEIESIDDIAIKMLITPKRPNEFETYIIPDLKSGQRYYVAVYSERASYGTIRRSELSNVVTFLTTALDVDKPIRIPLYEDMIYEGTIAINYNDDEYLTNYPTFRRLAHQNDVIDNDGVPEGKPLSRISAYRTWDAHPLEWYNVGDHKVWFELDGVYNLDYIYMIYTQNDNFKVYTSGDGVSLVLAYSGGGYNQDWRKLELNSNAKNNVKYIVLGFGKGVGDIFGFLPYGRRIGDKNISGKKFKHLLRERTVSEAVGTNCFLSEQQYGWIGKISDVARLYVEPWWVLGAGWGSAGAAIGKTPADIRLRAEADEWNWDTHMQALLDAGQKEIMFTFVRALAFLRAVGESNAADNSKPVDPSLDYKDFSVTTNPYSYTFFAWMMGAMAARWGFNDAPNIYNNFIENDGKRGLGLVRYWEWGNENEKYWEPVDRYYHPFEAAAIMSALYDGHMGTMGVGYGLKGADPSAKLVMAGMYSINKDYVKLMMNWWDVNRGKGNYPIDVINFHHYNTWSKYPGIGRDGVYDNGIINPQIAWGLIPEKGYLLEDTRAINKLRSLFAQNVQLACTEWGYGEQKRGLTSPADDDRYRRGRKKGIWLLRTMLIYLALDLDFMCHYWYAGDTINVDNLPENKAGGADKFTAEAFYTVGLVDGVTAANDRNRKPLQAWWYMASFLDALKDYKVTHFVFEGGVRNIIESDIFLTLHPELWAVAIEHKTTGKKGLVIWLGVEDFEADICTLRVASDVLGVDIVDFVRQDVRLSETGVTSTRVPVLNTDGFKQVNFQITETPTIVFTDTIGTKKLFEPIDIETEAVSPLAIKIAYEDRNIGTNKTRVYMSQNATDGFVIVKEAYYDNAEVTITDLLPNTQYYFRLQFIDGNMQSDVSDTYSKRTLLLLVEPQTLAVDIATSSTIQLSWDYAEIEANKIDEFVIYRSATIDGTYSEIGRVVKSERIYTDIGLVPNTLYYYKIKAQKERSVSGFSHAIGATTRVPVLDAPTVQQSTTNANGSKVIVAFDEELQDEQTAINAFTIIERLADMSVRMHAVTAIALDAIDARKLLLSFDFQIFKNSTVTIGYSAATGQLKSKFGASVNTFSAYVVQNNVLEDYVPIMQFSELYNIAVAGNTLTGVGQGSGIVEGKIAAGQSAILQFNSDVNDSIVLGLDRTANPENFTQMDFTIRKLSGRLNWRKDNISGNSANAFGKSIIRFRADGTNVNYEYSVDGGANFILVTSSPQPYYDLYIKFYCPTVNQQLVNLSGLNIAGSSIVITPDAPTNMIIDDNLNTVSFTLNPNYALSEHEYCSNYSSVLQRWAICSSNPLQVGDINIPRHDFAVRVRAATGRVASAVILNETELLGSINSNSEIMISRDNGGAALFGSNVLAEITDWLENHTFTHNLVVQLNTSKEYLFTDQFAPTYNNGTYWVTWQGAVGVRPVFNNQKNSASVWRIESNYTILRNLSLKNSDINHTGGAMVRGDDKHHWKVLDVEFEYGYVAIRATTNVHDVEIDNIVLRDITYGGVRINCETNIDGNLSIKNIYYDDIRNGGNIPGTVDSDTGLPTHFSAPLVLKQTNNLYVENVRALTGDRVYRDIGIVESSSNVVLKNIIGDMMYFTTTDGLTISNCYFTNLTGICYMNRCRNVNLFHNYFGDTSFYETYKFLKVRGNIFRKGIYVKHYVGTDKMDVEDNNVICADGSGKYIRFQYMDATPEYEVSDANLAAYLATGKGLNSVYLADGSSAINLNPYGSLRPNSAGKGLITAVIDGVSSDVYGTPRVYPTDAGPFSGLRPDANDVPAPPTVVIDNLNRTVVATHVLGASQILYRVNGGAWLQYTGVINVGDSALVANYYEFKIKSASYRNESSVAGSEAFTDKPDDNGYEVLRTVEVNFRSGFSPDSTDGNINEYHPDDDNPIDSTTLSLALIDKTGANAGITLSNFEFGFVGTSTNALPAGAYIRDENAMRSAFELHGGQPLSRMKLTGLDPDKFYQFYIVSCSQYAGHATRLTIGDAVVNKATGESYPYLADGELHSNPAVSKIYNRVPNNLGELILQIEKTGSGWQAPVINYLVFEETNVAKPL